MNAILRRRFEMVARVRDFLRVHRTEGAEAVAQDRLEELLKRAEALAAQQRAGVVATRAATEHRAAVRRALQARLLRYLSGVGAVAARENAELAAEFRLPRRRGSHQWFLTVARGMLDQATARKDLLERRGMSADLLQALAAAVVEYEQTLETTRAGRRAHVGASADLRAVASEISAQVRLLDGLVRYRFGSNAELMGAWKSARHSGTPVRSRGEAGAESGEASAVGGLALVAPAA